MFLENTTTTANIPWDSIQYLTGQINYGGRVTDDWDRHCLMTVLNQFFVPKSLKDDFRYSVSGRYFSPVGENLSDFMKYINELPIDDDPEIFGMHKNANITFQMQESMKILDTILELQPRTHSGGSSGDINTQINKLASGMRKSIPSLLSKNDALKNLFELGDNKLVSSLSTVLL